MPRVHRPRARASLTECNGFTLGDAVIVYYDDNKNRVGCRGTVAFIGKRVIRVKMGDGGVWEGTYRPTAQCYCDGSSSMLYPDTKEHAHLLGDRSAVSPPPYRMESPGRVMSSTEI
jgi:hypothetical protein